MDDSRQLPRSESKSKLAALITLSIAAIIIAALFFLTFSTVIRSNEFGVRQISFGPFRGISNQALAPGLHWNIPYYSMIYHVPRELKLLHFSSQNGATQEEVGGDSYLSPLEVQTSDRATVDLEATIIYQFLDQLDETSGGSPERLISRLGISFNNWEKKIKSVADDAVKRTLGALSTSNFYDPSLREEKIAQALIVMNKGDSASGLEGLNGVGIAIQALLVKRYTYRDERIENAIFQKNLQDQEEALSQAEGRLAEAQARSADEEARGEARNLTLKIEGEERAKIVRSEAELYQAEVKAKADLELARTLADVEKQKAALLSNSEGAKLFIARELTRLYGTLQGGVVSGLDPYDLSGMLHRINGEKSEERGK
jgi:regulator of protease activity HflC (stomatin/prohibitin superfamily)